MNSSKKWRRFMNASFKCGMVNRTNCRGCVKFKKCAFCFVNNKCYNYHNLFAGSINSSIPLECRSAKNVGLNFCWWSVRTTQLIGLSLIIAVIFGVLTAAMMVGFWYKKLRIEDELIRTQSIKSQHNDNAVILKSYDRFKSLDSTKSAAESPSPTNGQSGNKIFEDVSESSTNDKSN